MLGNDEGKILGALMTGGEPSSSERKTNPPHKRRKCRRKRKQRHGKDTDEQEDETKSVSLSCDKMNVSCDHVTDSVTRIVEYSSDSGEEELANRHAKLELPTFLKGTYYYRLE